jgi:hypothetical protein
MKTSILKIGMLGIVAAIAGCVYPDTLWELTPQIEYDRYVVPSGDIYKGTTTSINVYLKNTGKSAVSNLQTTFSSASPYVADLRGYIPFDAMAVGEAKYVMVSFDLSPATPDDAVIPINIDIADANGNKWTAAFSIKDIKTHKPEVMLNNATDITYNSFTLNGSTTTGSGAASDRGFYYGTSSSITAADKASVGAGTGSFSKTITGLTPATTYYVWAYAVNTAGESRSSYYTFSTESNAAYVPVVTLSQTISATYNTLTVSGSVGDGRGVVTDRGVYYGTSSDITMATRAPAGTGTGNFSKIITGLTPATTYYVWAYAVNAVGEGTSAPAYAATHSIDAYVPVVSSFTTTARTANSITFAVNIGDDRGNAVTGRGICWSTTNNYPTISDSRQAFGSGTGTFNATINSLQPATQYYFRVYATNSVGTAYGAVIATRYLQFGTITHSITGSSMTLSGSVNAESGVTVTERGICWSRSNASPTTSDTKVAGGSGNGSVSATISSLTTGTYYARAYAIVDGITYYGEAFSHTIY